MSHESYHCYIYIYIFFDICMYHDDMIIHYCAKVILYDSGDTRNLESHKSARFFAENLEEKKPSVGSAFMKLEDFWVLLSGRLTKGPRVAPSIYSIHYFSAS